MTFTLNFHSDIWRSALGRAEQVSTSIVCGLSTSRFACYRVTPRRGGRPLGARNGYYSVVLSVVDDKPFASCTCLGAFNSRLCWHIAAVVPFHSDLVVRGIRQALSPHHFRGVVSMGLRAPFLLPKLKKADGKKPKPFSPFKKQSAHLEFI
jgi:hypothetical protein